jgi:hypothetical protein
VRLYFPFRLAAPASNSPMFPAAPEDSLATSFPHAIGLHCLDTPAGMCSSATYLRHLATRNSQFAMRNHHASPHVRPWHPAFPPIVDQSSPTLDSPLRAQSGISLLSMAARLVPKQPLPAPCYARSGPAHRGYPDDDRLNCSSTLHRADRYLTLCATLSLPD